MKQKIRNKYRYEVRSTIELANGLFLENQILRGFPNKCSAVVFKNIYKNKKGHKDVIIVDTNNIKGVK